VAARHRATAELLEELIAELDDARMPEAQLLAETIAGELVVVDYKTDRARRAAGIAENEVQYAGQLDAYASALERVLGR
jgi:hypothetical protein